MLVRPPASINLAEIVDAVCPQSENAACQRPAGAESSMAVTVQEVWDELRSQQRETLEGLTLGQLLQRTAESSPMFYI